MYTEWTASLDWHNLGTTVSKLHRSREAVAIDHSFSLEPVLIERACQEDFESGIIIMIQMTSTIVMTSTEGVNSGMIWLYQTRQKSCIHLRYENENIPFLIGKQAQVHVHVYKFISELETFKSHYS